MNRYVILQYILFYNLYILSLLTWHVRYGLFIEVVAVFVAMKAVAIFGEVCRLGERSTVHSNEGSLNATNYIFVIKPGLRAGEGAGHNFEDHPFH